MRLFLSVVSGSKEELSRGGASLSRTGLEGSSLSTMGGGLRRIGCSLSMRGGTSEVAFPVMRLSCRFALLFRGSSDIGRLGTPMEEAISVS